MSLPTLLALTLLSSLAPPPRPQNSGRGRYVPPAASPAGRGGGGRSKGRYAPPSVEVTSAARKAREQRDLDLFGPPGEWRARKGQREWRNYKDEQQQRPTTLAATTTTGAAEAAGRDAGRVCS